MENDTQRDLAKRITVFLISKAGWYKENHPASKFFFNFYCTVAYGFYNVWLQGHGKAESLIDQDSKEESLLFAQTVMSNLSQKYQSNGVDLETMLKAERLDPPYALIMRYNRIVKDLKRGRK